MKSTLNTRVRKTSGVPQDKVVRRLPGTRSAGNICGWTYTHDWERSAEALRAQARARQVPGAILGNNGAADKVAALLFG
jgi:hypothetical protein